METPSPNAAYVTNQSDDVRVEGRPISLLSDAPSKIEIAGGSPAYIPQQSPRQSYIKAKPKAKCYYFAELGALDHFMIKHIAVLHLDELLANYFSLEELADLIDDKKNSTLWGKFVTSLKAGGGKKAPRMKGTYGTWTVRWLICISSEGTFGVPLDVLVEKNGVDSTLGAGATRIRIPAIIEDSISAMKQMDMSVEGVFRKNGNIRRLKELSEEIDKNSSSVDLMKESAVQVAALTKKFLRDMPEPLLTFGLHKLFVTAQSKSTGSVVLTTYSWCLFLRARIRSWQKASHASCLLPFAQAEQRYHGSFVPFYEMGCNLCPYGWRFWQQDGSGKPCNCACSKHHLFERKGSNERWVPLLQSGRLHVAWSPGGVFNSKKTKETTTILIIIKGARRFCPAAAKSDIYRRRHGAQCASIVEKMRACHENEAFSFCQPKPSSSDAQTTFIACGISCDTWYSLVGGFALSTVPFTRRDPTTLIWFSTVNAITIILQLEGQCCIDHDDPKWQILTIKLVIY